MSIVIKYFKRKLKPFKQCVDAQSKSFENELDNFKEKENLKQKKKSYFKLIRRNKKNSNKKTSNDYNRESVESGINSSYTNENSFNDAELERKSLRQQQLFNTPVSSVLSIDHEDQAQSQTKRFKLDDLSDDNSGCTCNNNLPTTSSYEEDTSNNSCFMTGSSIINSTPTNSYTSSMVTYNTKYNANSNLIDEDGLLSVSLMPQQSCPKTKVNEQSTPAFTENFAKIKSLKTNNSVAVNQANNSNSLKKCRRSNTTYTLAGSKCNNYIIDYFDKLELIKPTHNKQEKQACIRKLNESANVIKIKSKKSANITAESINCKNEVEKIQDVLFYDEPSLLNNTHTDNTFDTNEMSLNNNAGSQHEPAMLDSTNDDSIKHDESSDSAKLMQSEANTPTSLRKTNDSKSASKLNETNLANNNGGCDISIEKLRRSLSFPVLNSQSSSPISANVSKISVVKESCEPDEPVVKIDLEEKPTAFVRGDPQTRLSTNIKKMFKNVVKYQMNALNNLEKFYESQVNKLETERKRNLSINANCSEKINQYFDAQIKQLEERVQNNLKLICESKPNETLSQIVEPIKSNNSNKTLLSRRLSQLMLLKQLEKSNNNNNANNRLSRGNLKANLIALNQNNILPSKKLRNQSSGNNTNVKSQQQKKTTEFTESADLKETIFKRNLSLPYYQCSNKQNAAILLSKQLTERINSNNNLRMARKLEQQSQRRSSVAHLSAHSLSTMRGAGQRESSSHNGLRANHNIMVSKILAAAVAQTQYQKNISIKKQSASNENISKMVLLTNERFLIKSDNQNSSFKRQNKSACSLKSSSENQSLMSHVNSLNSCNDYSNDFSITLSKSNCSLFSTNNNMIFDNISSTTSSNNTSHLIKYQPPRYSDSHMQFKLNQQKLSLIKSAQESKRNLTIELANKKNNTTYNNSSSFLSSIESKLNTNTPAAASASNFLIETEV